MDRTTTLILLALSLAGCDRIPGTPQQAARAAVSADLFDPGAGQFTYIADTAQAVCGTVNGKNRMGAYVGAQPFIYEKAIKMAWLYQGAPEASDLRTLRYSSGDSPEWRRRFEDIAERCQFPARWASSCGAPLPEGENDICTLWQSDTDHGPFMAIERFGGLDGD